jgi:hypothetical protein
MSYANAGCDGRATYARTVLPYDGNDSTHVHSQSHHSKRSDPGACDSALAAAPLRVGVEISDTTAQCASPLVGEHDIAGIGSCVALLQCQDRYDEGKVELRARLLVYWTSANIDAPSLTGTSNRQVTNDSAYRPNSYVMGGVAAQAECVESAMCQMEPLTRWQLRLSRTCRTCSSLSPD